MTTHFDVPGEHLVNALAKTLKSEDAIQPPEWSEFAKTAVHKEKSPTQADWWYFRTASVMRKVVSTDQLELSDYQDIIQVQEIGEESLTEVKMVVVKYLD